MPELTKHKFAQIAAIAGLVVLFFMSLHSLRTFPDSYDDEGFYAAYGVGYVTTGHFSSPSIQSAGPFALGNAWNSRVNATIFGAIGHFTGYSVETARSIPFILVWLATALWFFIARRLGISGWFGILLFASSERIFYASHVFRPESTLVFFNTLFVYLIVCFDAAKPAFLRGLLNGVFVLAHGTGLVTAILNSVEFGLRGLKTARVNWKPFGLYAAASLIAIGMFYLVQIHDVGGWHMAQAQLGVFKQYQIKTSLFDSIRNDIVLRWGTELVQVGNSILAKVLRWYFYGVVLVISAFSARRFTGLPRKLGLLSLGCVVTYMLVVPEKIDLQIAEMTPFFLAAVISWYVAISKESVSRFAFMVLVSLICAESALSLHHAIKYRGRTQTQETAAGLLTYLHELKPSLAGRKITFVGNMKYWFQFKEFGDFRGSRYIEELSPFHGIVVTIQLGAVVPDPDFAHCKFFSKDPTGSFVTYDCP